MQRVGVDIAAGEEHFDEVNFPQLHGPHLKAIGRAKVRNCEERSDELRT